MIPKIKPGSPLAKAREYLRNVTLTHDLTDFGRLNEVQSPYGVIRGWYYDGESSRILHQLDAEILAKSLHCYISIEETEVESEEDLPLGASKTRGLPHLPASIAWPDNCLFLAQFNLADLQLHDIQQLLPKQGMLYFFINPNDSDCQVIYYEGPVEQLAIRPYTDEDFPDREYFTEEYEDSRYAVEFRKEATISIDKLVPALPNEMKAQVENLLGCTLVPKQVSDNLFGQPYYWQGEGEVYDEEPGDETGDGIEADLLLFQYEFGEGNVHYWITSEDLANRDFSKVYLTYSGT